MKKNATIAFPILTTKNDQHNCLEKSEFFKLSDCLSNNFYQCLDLATEVPEEVLGGFILIEDQYGHSDDYLFGICLNTIEIEKIQGKSKRRDLFIIYNKLRDHLYSLSYELYKNQHMTNSEAKRIADRSIEDLNQSVIQIEIGFGAKKRIYEANITMDQNYYEYTCERLFKEDELSDLAFTDETTMTKH